MVDPTNQQVVDCYSSQPVPLVDDDSNSPVLVWITSEFEHQQREFGLLPATCVQYWPPSATKVKAPFGSLAEMALPTTCGTVLFMASSLAQSATKVKVPSISFAAAALPTAYC